MISRIKLIDKATDCLSHSVDACAIVALSLANQRLVFHCNDQSECFNLSVILPGTALESTQALDTEF